MLAIAGISLMHLLKNPKIGHLQKAAVDPDQGLRFLPWSTFLVTVDNIKSYMNQDLFHFVNGR